MKSLSKEEICRFRDLKPKDIESNLFLYHLRQLIKHKIVEKTVTGRYSLSVVGRQYVDRSNLPTMKPRLQPKQLTILIIEAPDDKLIILKRLHVPYLGYRGLPSGKIHYGEGISEAATRELLEKTGLDDIKLTLRGNVLMRFCDPKTKEVISHINAYIHTGKTEITELDFKTEYFVSYIANKTELFQKKSFEGHKEIMECLTKHKSYFFKEFTFESLY
ncbi:MAG: NUDIX domain-containing protein [Patescibacteria group bacterium]